MIDMTRVRVWADGNYQPVSSEPPADCSDDFRIVTLPLDMLDTEACYELCWFAANGVPDSELEACVVHWLGG